MNVSLVDSTSICQSLLTNEIESICFAKSNQFMYKHKKGKFIWAKNDKNKQNFNWIFGLLKMYSSYDSLIFQAFTGCESSTKWNVCDPINWIKIKYTERANEREIGICMRQPNWVRNAREVENKYRSIAYDICPSRYSIESSNIFTEQSTTHNWKLFRFTRRSHSKLIFIN